MYLKGIKAGPQPAWVTREGKAGQLGLPGKNFLRVAQIF